jgi:fructose-1,6-bisphosphatase II / sedoheptulose-1,7-bisphosphatase
MGITDLDKKYDISEIVRGDSIFCATGITSCEFMNGIVKKKDKYVTETIFTYSKSVLEIVKKEITIT